MKKYITGTLLLMILTPSIFSHQNSPGKTIRAGISTDLLPYISAEITGEKGLSLQGWLSLNRFKYRIVFARTSIPENFMYDGIRLQELRVFAFIADYYFQKINKGPWIGSGIELWENNAKDKISENDISWTSLILTFGGGYTFMQGEHFYLNPFAAIHFNPAPDSVRTEKSSFDEKSISSSASVKIGWMF